MIGIISIFLMLVVVNSAMNGEDYCERSSASRSEIECKRSTCCHWNTWESGAASNNNKGRCWSDIGEKTCTDYRPFTRLGLGHCSDGYYAGWDGKGIHSQEACNEVCRKEDQCTYAAFKRGHTCSRYNGKSCNLIRDYTHTTYERLNFRTTEESVGIESEFQQLKETNNALSAILRGLENE